MWFKSKNGSITSVWFLAFNKKSDGMNKKITIKFKLTRQNVLFDPNKTWHWLSTVKFSFEVVDVTAVCVIDFEEFTPFAYLRK